MNPKINHIHLQKHRALVLCPSTCEHWNKCAYRIHSNYCIPDLLQKLETHGRRIDELELREIDYMLDQEKLEKTQDVLQKIQNRVMGIETPAEDLGTIKDVQSILEESKHGS